MIVLTGAAGFIGFHVAKMLLSQGHHIIGIDNMNDYYDVSLKKGGWHNSHRTINSISIRPTSAMRQPS